MGSVAQVFDDNGRVTEGHFRNGFVFLDSLSLSLF